MKAIFNRASVRSFDGRKVEPEKIELLMKAAMAAPSACNQQPWEFVVITDPATLGKLAECSPYAGCIRQAPLGIAVCMRTEGLPAPSYTQIDASAATENILLEAVHLGLGTVSRHCARTGADGGSPAGDRRTGDDPALWLGGLWLS